MNTSNQIMETCWILIKRELLWPHLQRHTYMLQMISLWDCFLNEIILHMYTYKYLCE